MEMPLTAGPTPMDDLDRRLVARVERAFARYGGNPFPFFYIPLAAVTVGVIGFDLTRDLDRAIVAGVAVLAGAWFFLWMRLRDRQSSPRGRLIFRLSAFIGCVLMGALVSYSFFYTIVIVPLFARYFVEMPLIWSYPAGLLMLIPLDLAFKELARTAPPGGGSALTMLIVRAVVMLVIGIMFTTLRTQRDEKQRLLERLTQTERKSGQLEERQRLAREIHDTLAQGFAAILAHLETAELGREKDGADRDSELQHLASARRVARDSLEEARRMMAALRPEILETADLPAAMNRIAESWAKRTGLPCTVSITGTANPLHRDIEVALLRTAQESLANAWKHARPSRVTITLSYMGDIVVLDVQDDGVGGAGAGGFGFGLRSMQERMEQIGGTLTVESTPGEGTTISASAPNVATTAEMPFYRRKLPQI